MCLEQYHTCMYYILDKIYENSEKYFPFKNKNGTSLTPPTREKLKNFLIETFQNFSIFKSAIGVYKINQV